MSDEWVDADQWEDVPASPLAQLAPGNFQPIGDAPPDFGEAKVQPGEVDKAAHTIGMAIAPDATKRLDELPALTADDAKNELIQAVMGPFGKSDLAKTAASKLIPVAPAAAGLWGMMTGIGNDAVESFGGEPTKTAADAVSELSQKLSYEPETNAGKALAAAIDVPFEALQTAGGALGSKTLDKTGSPMLAAIADTAVQALPMIFGGERAGKIGKEVPKSEVPRESMDTEAANAIPISPDARHAAKQEKFGLNDEQKAAFTLPKDPLTGWDTKAELDPTIDAARKSGEPSTYVEMDLRNLNGLNKHSGSISAADEHMKAITAIAKQELDSTGEVVPFKKGGDEFAFVVKGADPDTVHEAMASAQEKVNAYVESNQLHEIDNPKGGDPGTGIHFAATEIHPERSVGDTVKSAESAVEARKLGAPYERPSETIGGRPLAEEPAARSPAETAPRAGKEAPAAETAVPEQVNGPAASDARAAPRQEPSVAEPTRGPNAPQVALDDASARDSRVANAATYVDRATRGVEQLPEAEHKGWAESKSQAAERIAQNPDYARNLAAEVAKKPRAIDDVETMALGAERQKLQDAYHQTHDEILKARESGNPIQEAQAHAKRAEIESQLDLNERATKSAGTPLARALAARNALHTEDYTPARNITRAKVAFGDKFNEGIRKQVDALSERLQSAEATIARMEANKKAPNLKVERLSPDERMQKQVQAKMDKLQQAIEKRLKACPI